MTRSLRTGRRVWWLMFALSNPAFVGVVMAQDCSGGQFEGSEPYSHDESLPFDFHQPLKWDAQSMAAGQQIVSVHKPHAEIGISTTVVTMDIIVAFQPDRYPDMTEDTWQQSMDVIATVPYADDSLMIFSPSWAIMAKFLVPFQGKKYQVSVNFNNGEFCPKEAQILRTLFVDTLTPNDDTRFAGQ